MDKNDEINDFTDVVVKEEYEITEIPDVPETREWVSMEANSFPGNELAVEPKVEPEDMYNDILLPTKPQDMDCSPDLEQSGNHQCAICGRSCKNRFTLKTHMARHTKKKGFPCPYCTRVIIQKKRLKRHLKTNHECNVCGAMFRMKIERATHMEQVHTGNSSGKLDPDQPLELKKFYPCHSCGRVFVYEKTMRTHLLMECKGDPLTCSICAQTFNKTVTLTNHVRTEHTVSKILPNCKLCAMSFISDGHFERHMRTHKKNFNCPHCSEGFSYKFQYDSHIRNFHFSRKAKLEFPQNTLKSEFCSTDTTMKFKTKDFISQIKSESELETKEKNEKFQCPQCFKEYVKANKFVKHLSSHTEYSAENFQSFQCSICSRKFHSNISLGRHKNRFCMASSYICPICKNCCSTPNDFFEHLRDHETNLYKPTAAQKTEPSDLLPDIKIKTEPPETLENVQNELGNL